MIDRVGGRYGGYVRVALLGLGAGAVTGGVIAVVGAWWQNRDGRVRLGGYGFRPLADVSVVSPSVHSWTVLWPGLLAGAFVGLAGALAVLVCRRSPSRRGALSAAAVVLLVAAAGGALIGAVAHDRRTADGPSRAETLTVSIDSSGHLTDAYGSELSLTLAAGNPRSVAAVCAGAGGAAGLLALGVVALLRRRRRRPV